MDETAPIFKAIADSHRRLLLDLLHRDDGQTLGALCAHLPEMTRFGCMKHLKVLDEAGLVIAQKVGREKRHYLNPVPIQSLYDRWVSKYARPWAATLTGMKDLLEAGQMDQKPDHVYEVYIRTTPERLWQALVDGELTRQYYYNSRVESDWQQGSHYLYRSPDGGVLIDGDVIEADPPRRLVTTFRALWSQGAAEAVPTTVTFEISPVGAACKLTLIHAGLEPASPLTSGINTGWTQILSSLKTLLETGEPLVIGD